MVKKSKMVSIDVAAESQLASACKWVVRCVVSFTEAKIE